MKALAWNHRILMYSRLSPPALMKWMCIRINRFPEDRGDTPIQNVLKI
jgi:hypothetical protein